MLQHSVKSTSIVAEIHSATPQHIQLQSKQQKKMQQRSMQQTQKRVQEQQKRQQERGLEEQAVFMEMLRDITSPATLSPYSGTSTISSISGQDRIQGTFH